MGLFGLTKKKITHTWGDWVYEKEKCIEYRKCTTENCTECYDERKRHDFALPKYEANNEDGCVQVEHCQVCGHEEKQELKHNFREYKFHTDNCCSQSRQCMRCNYVDTTNVAHNFDVGKLLPYKCIVEKMCKRCGFIEHSSTDHLWTEAISYEKCFNDVIDAKLDRRNEINRILDRPSEKKDYKLLAEVDTINDELAFLNQALSKVEKNQLGRYCTHCLKIEYLGKKENITYPKGFISYSWKHKELIDSICSIIKNKGVQILRDSCDLNSGESIREFMEQINNVDFVIMIITPEYLKSINCMYEAVQATKNLTIRKKKILTIVYGKDTVPDNILGNLQIHFSSQLKKFIKDGNKEKQYICETVINGLKGFFNEIYSLKFMKLETTQQIPEYELNKFIDSIKKEYGMK